MSSLSLSVEELQQRFLTCPGCSCRFNNDEHHPRLLPCLHTCCYACALQRVKDKSLRCPDCFEKHSFPGDLEDCFPKDSTRRDLHDFVEIKKSPTQVRCTACGENISTHRCAECAEYLCTLCVDAHRRTTATKGHRLLTMSELRSMEHLYGFEHPQNCPIHIKKQLEMYCDKEECKKPICILCPLVTCKEKEGHVVRVAQEVFQERQMELQKKAEALQSSSSHVQQVMTKIRQEVTNVDEQEEDILSEIDVTFDSLIQRITKQKEELKKKTRSIGKRKKNALEQQETELRLLLGQMENALTFTDQALVHRNVPAFLQIERTILNRLEVLLAKTFDKEPHEMANFGFHEMNLEAEVSEKIDVLTMVWSSSVFPPHTDIKPETEAKLNETMTFSITFHDYQKQPLEIDNLQDLVALVTDPNGKETTCTISQSEDDNGSYKSTFTPKSSGRHFLEIRLISVKIGRRSFNVTNRSSKKDSQINRSLLRNTTRPSFIFERRRCHADVTVSADGTTFLNQPTSSVRAEDDGMERLQVYKGTYGTFPFTNPGRYFYEIEVEFRIIKELDRNNLVFEIGLAREKSIDRKHHTDTHQYAWSMIGSHHPECDAVCLHVALDSQILYHQKISRNVADEKFNGTFGFILDTEIGHWSVFGSDDGKHLCLVDGVDCSEPLLPVVGGYNPALVEVTMTLRCDG